MLAPMTEPRSPIVEPITAWAPLSAGELGNLILVAGPVPEALMFSGELESAPLASEELRGTWFGGMHGGDVALCFGAVDIREPGGAPHVWYFPLPPTEVVDGVVKAGDHLVVLVAGDASNLDGFGHNAQATTAILTRAAVVRTRAADRQSFRSLQLRGAADASAGELEGLVDLEDAVAVTNELAFLTSRAALADGETLTDNQLLPMSWRPWHYSLVEDPRGIHWRWPVLQVYFGLKDPSTLEFGGIAAPTETQARHIRSYLTTVRVLATSIAVNSKASIKFDALSAGQPGDDVVVVAPHSDALRALLTTLRQLFDPDEGSGFAFVHMRNALATAAHQAGLTDLTAALKAWKKANTTLRREHLDALQHELAAELSEPEGLDGGPRRLWPYSIEISSQTLIETFMYGEILHRDEDDARQIAAWDSDPVVGPSMRQQASADAQAFVDLFGAFAGFLEKWLNEHQLGEQRQPGLSGALIAHSLTQTVRLT